MKKVIRRVFAFMVALVMCLQFGTIDSRADATVTIALSASSISIGNSVTATISVNGSDISAYTIYVSYDSSILEFSSASGSAQANGGGGTLVISGTGAGSVSATFTAVANGTASISTSGSEVYNINLEQIAISHAGVTVTVATADNSNADGSENNDGDSDSTTATTESNDDNEDDRSSNCNLSSLQISPGTLQPEFSPNTTSYYVQVDEDVTSMVVSATTEDSKATTDVWGANLIEPGENTVQITVTAENGAVKVYSIRVVAGEDLGDAAATIDNVLYTFVNSEDGLEVPEGFSSTKMKYKDWEVLAFESPNKKIKIVCMTDENNEYYWFIYDEKTDSFVPYNEYSSNYNRYIIVPIPEGVTIPEGFAEKQISINNNKITAYQSTDIDDKNLYLVYAINLSGSEGFYMYDSTEGAFMRYVPMVVTEETIVYATPAEATPTQIEVTTPSDDGFFTRQVLIYFLCGAGALILIFIICLISFGVKIKNLNDELDKADDMVNQLASTNNAVNHKAIDSDSVGEVEEANKVKHKKASKDNDSVSKADVKSEVNNKPNDNKESENSNKSDTKSVNDMEMPDVDALVAEIEALRLQTENINNKIKEDYDANMDSAFADDGEQK